MKNREFEELLKETLNKKTQNISPSPFMLQKIKANAACENPKERFRMKLLSTKKLVVIGVICIASVTCFAAVKLSGVTSSGSIEFSSIEDVNKYEDKLGFEAKYVDAFDNGFVFKNGGTGETQGQDSEGKPIGKAYKTLNLTYVNDQDKWVALIVENGSVYADSGEKESTGYTEQMYKFVPTDYVLTEEDKKAEADGSLVISVGSDEVEINNMETYLWQDGALYYSITANDCNLGEAALKAMSEQIINN